MRFELPDGSEAQVFIRHVRDEQTNAPFKTTGTLKINLYGAEQEFKAEAVCSPKDQFVKRTGLHLVADRLVTQLRPATTKETRRAIFKAICG